MPWLTARGRKYSKMGLAFELPVARKLLEHSKKVLAVFAIDQIYCIGMVGKQRMMYAKSSCDFIARIDIDGEKSLLGWNAKQE
jgi:hypothetical protein